ncbi:MAG: hypothetical protein AAGF76_09945 [Pseudomonadota bacterium]
MRTMLDRVRTAGAGAAAPGCAFESGETVTALLEAVRRLADYSAHQSDRIDEMGERLRAQTSAIEGQSLRLAALVRARREAAETADALGGRIAGLEERAAAAERQAMALAAANRRLISIIAGEAPSEMMAAAEPPQPSPTQSLPTDPGAEALSEEMGQGGAAGVPPRGDGAGLATALRGMLHEMQTEARRRGPPAAPPRFKPRDLAG